MGRRTLLLVAALAVAAIGTTMVFLYVNGVNDRAIADQQPVQVLVATAPIAAGTSAQDAQSAGALEKRTVSRASAAQGALSDISPIADKVALAPIFVGEQILQDKFGDRTAANALPIPDGKLAVSVQLGDPARVAGFVEPGAEVAIFLTIAPGRGGSGQEVTRVLLPKVQVIAAGATTVVSTTTTAQGETQTEQLPKALLTLAVNQSEAQKVVYGSQHGQMYFGLLTKDSKIDKSDAGVNLQNLFD
ncbi:MAG: pilus assembly protein CpaB [Actinomycetota bacterium]|nr:pilus assembly protein CpaB [Actinomycetota bacterium]